MSLKAGQLLPAIGAHISAVGGLQKLLERADDLKVEAIQLHPSAPQSFRVPIIDPAAAQYFSKTVQKRAWPVFFHSIYLINLANEDDRLWHASLSSIVSYLKAAPQLGAIGTITHVGSHKGKGFAAVKDRLKAAAAKLGEGVVGEPAGKFIIENTAGGGGTLGRDLDELAALYKIFNQELPTAVCLDTCHLYAAGINVASEIEWQGFLDEFDAQIGLTNLAVIHLNDSKFDLDSKRDRHANLGEGTIGEAALARVVQDPRLRHVAFILEVPGVGKGPDLENIERAKSWRAAGAT